ncbi:MAG: penicillin-binding protein 1C [Fibrobacterota bacterium]|nr:MAG: penicillin-binding protein 1C [Fibrobacterota bacterium]
MTIRRVLSNRWTKGVGILLLAWVLIRWTLPDPLVPSSYATAVYDREGRLLGARCGTDGQWRFPEGDSVPNRFLRSLLAAEDQRFWWHPGIDPIAVFRSARSNLRGGRRQGASTLTMQLARISRRFRGADAERTWWAKVVEVWLSVRLELSWSKERILGAYCAHAPFGGNVVGLEAASWRWYGKRSQDLSWGEAALLAAIPNAPARLRPQGDTARLRGRRDWILARLQASGEIDSLEAELARSEPLPRHPHALPQAAPHVVELFHTRGSQKRWHSELDANLQTQVFQLAKDQAQDLRGQGIRGIAVVVAELREGAPPAIRAWVGGVEGPGGDAWQVDLALAPRSTGSTLKPFLYGLLLDQGLILPRQWIFDVPTRFGDFRPANASGTFEGLVAADQALARSLNVPWVRQLRILGIEPFSDVLVRAGMWHLFRPADDYGLALALGSGEASLVELVGMYAGLGSNGLAQPMDLGASLDGSRLRVGGPPLGGGAKGSLESAHKAFLAAMGGPGRKEQVLSPGATWLTLKAMRIGGRIEEEAAWKAFAAGRSVAWKTGTSFGHRDAWTIGITPRWVVGVWAGNPRGDGRPQLWGSKAAAPLMFRILPLLPQDGRAWPEPPSELVRVGVCSLSGLRRSPICPPGDAVLATPAGKAAPQDSFYQILQFDSARAFQVDAACQPLDRQVRETLLVAPVGAGSYYREVFPGRLPQLPPVRPDCHDVARQASMEVLLPEENTTLTLPIDLSGEPERMVVELRHRDRAIGIRCFLDGRDLGMETRFRSWSARPAPGTHVLVCSDEAGESVRRRFRVEHSSRANRDSLLDGRKMGTMAVQ